MALQDFWQSVENWPLSQFIAESTWAFPTLETIHVIAIVTVVGSVAIMDLRLLGLASKKVPVTMLEKDTLRWTWAAFAIAAVTGSLLVMSKAPNYVANPYFLWKLAVILAAGVNMAIFHAVTWKSIGAWNTSDALPRGARLAGGISLGLWVLVVFLARAIGFTLDKFGPN
jgi:hypothetical protein